MISFDVITVFPQQIEDFLKYGVFRIAQEDGLLKYNVHDLRKWTSDKHRTIDDRPYGGGAGMVLKVEPIYEALEKLRKENSKVIIFTPTGKTLEQTDLKQLSSIDDAHYILLCGHYEGFDHRIHENLVDMEVSIGEYVLSGGEIPALTLMDGITRLVPGVLGNKSSLEEESFEDDSLEYPHYTRPEEFKGWKVPEVLLSGNHEEIRKWRENKSKKTTK